MIYILLKTYWGSTAQYVHRLYPEREVEGMFRRPMDDGVIPEDFIIYVAM